MNIIKNMKITILKQFLKISILFLLFSSIQIFAQTMTPAQAKVSRENFISDAKKLIGSSYEYGAVGPEVFDCSGLVYYLAQQSLGQQLPRTAKALYSHVRIIPEENREEGDLIFFKTTSSGQISHVGIYIGDGQFISAISDGPNSGVIVSSLNQPYWMDKYVATGQILPSGRESTSTVKTKTESKDITISLKDENFSDNLVFDFSTYVDWALISPHSFIFQFRGVDIRLHAQYKKWNLSPGIGTIFRINKGLDTFQLPVVFSFALNDYFSFYAGPVFTFNDVKLLDSDKEIKSSIFPGIIGFSFSTPSLVVGKTKIQAVQDISYTVYNNMDGSALSFIESISAGLVMYTGIKILFPLSIFGV